MLALVFVVADPYREALFNVTLVPVVKVFATDVAVEFVVCFLLDVFL